MYKKAATFKVKNYVWAFFCLCSVLSIPLAKADYKVVYQHHSARSIAPATSSEGSDRDIWRAFQSDFTLDHQAYRPEVKAQIAWFMAHRKYLYAAAKNARPYLYYINLQIKKRGLPAEFALLPIIESAYDPFAYSVAGAAGLWQMMPATASDFGLKQDWWYDGRRDVVASTNAALDYLVYLQNFFSGNWMFTVAAYHAGQGTVLNAIKKNSAKGESTSFWSLPLGKQTQMYIPKLLALAEMIAHPEKYPLDMPQIPDRPYLTQVDVGSQIDLSKAAALSGLPLNVLLSLNPGFNRWATSPEGPYFLVVPIQNEAQLREGLSLLPQSHRVTWERYDVKSGDTLGEIATKYHTTRALLQQVNKMDDMTIHVGDVIFIPNSKRVVLKSVSAASPIALMKPVAVPVASSVKSTQKIRYVIQRGDSLVKIGRQFSVSVAQIEHWNSLTAESVLHPGKTLLIYPPPVE